VAAAWTLDKTASISGQVEDQFERIVDLVMEQARTLYGVQNASRCPTSRGFKGRLHGVETTLGSYAFQAMFDVASPVRFGYGVMKMSGLARRLLLLKLGADPETAGWAAYANQIPWPTSSYSDHPSLSLTYLRLQQPLAEQVHPV
jgi:hypothetical protein